MRTIRRFSSFDDPKLCNIQSGIFIKKPGAKPPLESELEAVGLMPASILTEYFTISEPQNLAIDEFCVFQKLCSPDREAVNF